MRARKQTEPGAKRTARSTGAPESWDENDLGVEVGMDEEPSDIRFLEREVDEILSDSDE